MTYKQRAWLLILLLALVCGGSVWGIAYFRSRSLENPQSWLRRFPARDALVVYVSFSGLRQTGLLQLLAHADATEPEYRTFVQKTGFDYIEDLDAVLASFAPSGKYFIVQGHFDWKRLEAYANSQGGRCLYTYCTLNGSTPERKISYFPLQSTLMGLAVSPDADAAQSLQITRPGLPNLQPPQTPVWLYLPGAMLKDSERLPESTRPFAAILQNANSALLTLAPRDTRFEAGLQVLCRSEQDAVALQTQLQHATSSLKELFQRQNRQIDERDISSLLTAGTFRHSGANLIGSWPISRAFLEALLGA